MIRTEVVDFSVLRKDYEETDTFSFLGKYVIVEKMQANRKQSA